MAETLDQDEPESTWQHTRYLEATLGLSFASGNRVDVLHNGKQIFPAMLEAIERAREEINLVTFVYWTGEIADRMATALAEKAKAGLHVRVLLDAFGAATMDDELATRMEEAGVQLRWFRPILRWRLWQCDNRTHRKVLVCDHSVGFTGGVGIAREWEGDARDPSEWRDVHVRIEGPAVDGLNAAFWNDWLETIAYEEAPRRPAAPRTPDPGSVRTMVVRSTATPNGSENATLVSALIAMAEQRLYIATAYFVPDQCFVKLLARAAARGVDVQLLMPGPHTDKRFVNWASESVYASLLDQGIRIFRYQRTMLHAKYLVLDDSLSMIGSTNFNQRSLKKDNEISVLFHDRGVNEALRESWERDLAESCEVHESSWARRGGLSRALEAITIPFQHQL